MSRRNTIIISVVVNVVLLAVLFISALTSKHKNKDSKIQNTALLEETTIDAKDLFSSNGEKDNLTVADLQAVGIAPNSQILNEQNLSLQNGSQNLIDQNDKSPQYTSILDEKNISKNNENVIYKLPEIENKNIDNVAAASELTTREIKVKKGDTLDKIARRNKVKVSEIIKINNLSNSFLKIGQVLQIPTSTKEISKTQKTENTSLKSSTAEYYTIKVGDNPYTIAIKHSIKLNELLKLNNLDDKKAKKLKPGDKLRIR